MTTARPAPVRVVSVVKGLGPGGAERLLVALSGAWPELGVAHHVVHALAWKDHLVGDLEATGTSVEGLGVHRLADVRWIPRLLRAVRRIRPDVIHVHSPALAPAVRLTARLGGFGRPRPAVVTTEHNAWSTYHRLTRWADALTAPLDDAGFAVSDEVHRSIRPARLRRRYEPLRHGIDLVAVRHQAAHRADVRAELGAGDDDVLVVTVANYREQKDYPTLLAAAAAVVAAEPRARFVAVGQGPLASEVERRHRELGLGDRFVLTGYRPDATAVIAAGDLFTLSSRYEGLPVALMEALALGCPVVATAVGGVAETVDDRCGHLVPPGDPDALAEALLAAIRDPRRRARWAAGAAILGEQFGADRAAARLALTYQALSGR